MKRRKRRSKKKQADHNLSLLGPKFSKKIKKSLQFRLSQVKIVNFLLARLLTGKNIGIVFATSLGKTIIDILFIDAVWQLAEINERPLPKFLILVPTIDLAQQFSNDLEFFRQFQTEDIAILAATSAKRRRAIYNSPAKIIISTPQGIKNDIRQEIIPLNFFQYLILDEAHHSRGKYAYAVIAEIIRPHVRIIAQTATAGQLKKREEIAANLNLEGWYRARIEEELAWLNPIERKEINIPYNEYQHPEWWEIDKNFQALSQRYRTELFNLFDQHFSHLLTARVATSGLTPAAMKNRLKTDPDFSPTVLQPALQIWETLKKSNNYLRFQQMEEIKKYLLNQNGAGISLKMLSLWTSLRQLTEIHRRLFQEGYKSFSAYYHQLAAEQKLSSQRVCSDLIMIMTEIWPKPLASYVENSE